MQYTNSIFNSVTKKDLRFSPYPHLNVRDCLPQKYYNALSSAFPLYENVDHLFLAESNVCGLINAINYFDLVESGLFDGEPDVPHLPLVEFMRYHTSSEFFQDIVRVFGEAIRQKYPFLERRLGKSLEEASVGLRGTTVKADFVIDCQFGFNTPVRDKPSTVRGPHVDKPFRLASGLLYFRLPEDTSTGGDLNICKFTSTNKKFIGNYEVSDDNLEVVDVVPYEQNRLIFFLNSDESIHAVTKRSLTDFPRRYINFLIEFPDRLF